MTARPPIDPRLTILAGRLARLGDLKSEAALVTAGLVSIADQYDLLTGLLTDMPTLPISSAFLATSQSVDELIATGTRLLADIEQARGQHTTTVEARPTQADDLAELHNTDPRGSR
ncbi:hypothetical protein [Lentzea sp. CA-135723]|uniref:hypothetical protein n=1 Tax=Lentzea sp. CA-135723 TaxID=3239950 RepID=UPI003D8A84D4